jgi:hypothetical protein
MSDRRRPHQEILDLLEAAGPFDSIDQVNRFLARHTAGYNARPQEELGGLSPDQVQQLLSGDWFTWGALRLNRQLTVEDVGDAPLFADARTLLSYVAAEQPIKETPAKNLPRVHVAQLLSRLRTTQPRGVARKFVDPPPKNEEDVVWLPELRHVLAFAGLLTRRKGLRLSTRGRSLLADERAGELYALLFHTLFRTLNLAVFDRLDRYRGLQSTVAFSFYKLRTAARDWRTADDLGRDAWLPTAREPLTDWEITHQFDWAPLAFARRVLEPLVEFGLLHERRSPTEDEWRELVEYRLSPLYNRFLRFEFVLG